MATSSDRAGDGGIRTRGHGDEPRSQGEDARRPGRSGRIDRDAAQRQAVLHSAMQPGSKCIPSGNVVVDITSSTVFGAKFVEFVTTCRSLATALARRGLQDNDTSRSRSNGIPAIDVVLSAIDPAKLNQTLGAIAGVGERARAEDRPDHHRFRPYLPRRSDPVSRSATTSKIARGHATPTPMRHRTCWPPPEHDKISNTLVDEQQNLDAFLLAAIGLADTGNDVFGTNRQALTNDLHMLVPTTTC